MEYLRVKLGTGSPDIQSDIIKFNGLDQHLFRIFKDLFPFSRAVFYNNNLLAYLCLSSLEYSLFYDLLQATQYHIQNLLPFISNQMLLSNTLLSKRAADLDDLAMQPVFMEELNNFMGNIFQNISTMYGTTPRMFVEIMHYLSQAMGLNIYLLTLSRQVNLESQLIGRNDCLGGIFILYLDDIDYFYILYPFSQISIQETYQDLQTALSFINSKNSVSLPVNPLETISDQPMPKKNLKRKKKDSESILEDRHTLPINPKDSIHIEKVSIKSRKGKREKAHAIKTSQPNNKEQGPIIQRDSYSAPIQYNSRKTETSAYNFYFKVTDQKFASQGQRTTMNDIQCTFCYKKLTSECFTYPIKKFLCKDCLLKNKDLPGVCQYHTKNSQAYIKLDCCTKLFHSTTVEFLNNAIVHSSCYYKYSSNLKCK